VPARSDLFPICSDLATRAGIKTVWRGWLFPCELKLGPEQYPAMGFRPMEEGVVSGSEGFALAGSLDLDVWIFHGKEGIDDLVLNPQALKPLDDLHDALLDHLSDSYPEIHSQTISMIADESRGWTPYWWYIESPHAGATLRVNYRMGYAPKAH